MKVEFKFVTHMVINTFHIYFTTYYFLAFDFVSETNWRWHLRIRMRPICIFMNKYLCIFRLNWWLFQGFGFLAFKRWANCRNKFIDETNNGTTKTAKPSVIKKQTFTCNICGKSITSKISNLKRHLKLHMEHDRFYCNNCPRSYQSKGNFMSHVPLHHKLSDPNDITFTIIKVPPQKMPFYR